MRLVRGQQGRLRVSDAMRFIKVAPRWTSGNRPGFLIIEVAMHGGIYNGSNNPVYVLDDWTQTSTGISEMSFDRSESIADCVRVTKSWGDS